MNTQRRMLIIVFAMLSAAMVALLWSVAPHSARANSNMLYVAPPPAGDDAYPCSLGEPCATVQHAVDVSDPGDHILVATGVYTGVQASGGMTQVVYISTTVSVQGGYSSDFGTWDPDTFPTTLDAEGEGRVVSIVGPSITATLDSLVITGGDATGITADCPPANGVSNGCGGGIFVYQAEALVFGNVISGNLAAVSVGSNSASGGGICLHEAGDSVISGNLIIGNYASTGERGMGGGIHLHYPRRVQVLSNRLLDNVATTSTTTHGWGGAIATGGSGAAAVISGNYIEGNRVPGSDYSHGAGIYQGYGASTFSGNYLTGNVGPESVYLGAYEGGRFEANQVVSNTTVIGVQLVNGGGPVFVLASNIVARSGEVALGAQAYSGKPLDARLLHNTLVGDGTGYDYDYGVYTAGEYVTLTLTHTIVADFDRGIVNDDLVSSTMTADHTLFWNVGDVGIAGSNPVYGNPAFIDPSGGDYHIGPGSAAVDAALDIGEESDVDGDKRPIGAPDIGADEGWGRVRLPLILRGS